jgi:serine/threonine protein kinase
MAHQNCYCINPLCNQPDYPDNYHSNFCHQCGSNLLLNDKYRVERLLSNDSGFGIIYEAKLNNSRKILKVLKPEHNNTPKVIELFKQEYQVLYNLTLQKITGIPQVENDDYFQYQTKIGLILHCIVMEKVEGIDLIQWLKNNGQISQKQAIKWLREITEILAKVHQQNYFHRDIKPHNIMQRNNGELVLIDFGTAREETQTYYQKLGNQQVTGINSVGYTPVEQLNGQAVMQSDFFALGRTFVHLLTDKHPVDMYDNYNNVFNWRSYTENINPLLLDFIDELMAVSAKDRPANTKVILQRLNEIESAINQGNIPVNYPNTSIYPPNPVSYTPNIAQPPSEKPQNKIGLILIFIFSLSLSLFLGLGILLNLNKQTQNNNNNKNPHSPENQTTKNTLSSPQISSQPSVINTPTPLINKFSQLENYLKTQNWKSADIKTLSIIFENSSNINNFSCTDLKEIEGLWIKYSQGKFGFTVQKPIYFETGNQPGIKNNNAWRRFADRVGWRVNGVWLEKYEYLNLSLNAPDGQLPAFAGQSGKVNRDIIDKAISCGL